MKSEICRNNGKQTVMTRFPRKVKEEMTPGTVKKVGKEIFLAMKRTEQDLSRILRTLKQWI